jgi:Tfp pilus assembly protein PilE
MKRNHAPVRKQAPTTAVSKGPALVLFLACFFVGGLPFTAWLLARMDDHHRSEGSGVEPVLLFLLACLSLTVMYILVGHLVMREPLIRLNEAGKREWCGPTLVEIGIILTIVAIFLLILIPNFLEGATRAPVARAKSEMHNLGVNLEDYYLDHNSYPPAVNTDGNIVSFQESENGISEGYVPWLLTTPTAYASSLPYDMFHKVKKRVWGPYRYATNGTSCWIMSSCGPDGDYDIGIGGFPDPEKGNCDWEQFVSQDDAGRPVEYDASNGTASSGDIVSVGP